MSYFSKPSCGTKVKLIIKKHLPVIGGQNWIEVSGTAIPSEDWDSPYSFRLKTKNYRWADVLIIDVRSLIDIKFIGENNKVEKIKVKEVSNKDIKIQIKGSKGNFYTVQKIGNHYICTCVGFGYRKHCKHINEAIKKVEIST